MFFTLIFGDNFLFLILVNCVHDENCREKITPVFQKVQSLWREQILSNIYEDLAKY